MFSTAHSSVGKLHMLLGFTIIGMKQDISNYRHIWIKLSLQKQIEKVISPHLNFAFKNLIIDKQHSLTAGRSRVRNLFIFVRYIVDVLIAGNKIYVVQYD